MDGKLQNKVEQLRLNFETVRGIPFKHFFCPILHVDEPAALCKGHIVPESVKAISASDKLKASNATLPQRADVDHFYGAVAEADFGAIIRDRNKSPIDLWLDHGGNRQHRPRLEVEGMPIPHYFPPSGVKSKAPGHTSVEVRSDEQHICNVVVKLSPDELMQIADKKIDIVFDRDYEPAGIATLIKAAHLTLFQLMKYDHVFSPAGYHLAAILGGFYRKHVGDQKVAEADICYHFMRYKKMAFPMGSANSEFEGTITDHRMFVCVGASDKIFALAVIVKMLGDSFCVFVPGDDAEAVGTYESFINDPPNSIRARHVKFVSETVEQGAHWLMDKTDFRAYLRHPDQ